jgi:hypothetical protein
LHQLRVLRALLREQVLPREQMLLRMRVLPLRVRALRLQQLLQQQRRK